MRLRSAVFIVALALTVAPAAAGADTVLGPDDGVSAVRTANGADVTFTPAALAAAKVAAGREIELGCRPRTPVAPLLLAADDDDAVMISDGRAKIGADGVAHVEVYTGGPGEKPRTLDYCVVSRITTVSGNEDTAAPIAQVGLTPTGVDWADESAKTNALVALLIRARGPLAYKSVAELGPGVVALDTPGATPPAGGALGYWTDGAHATVVALSRAGRRLAMQDLGGGMLRTNLQGEIDVGDEASPDAFGPLGGDENDPEQDAKDPPYAGHAAVWPGDGARATLAGRRLTVRFTRRSAAAFRAIAGRRVRAVCLARPTPTPLFGSLMDNGTRSTGWVRAPKHGGRVAITLGGHAKADTCLIFDNGTAVAVVAPTATGLAWARDMRAIFLISGEGIARGLVASGAKAYRTTASAVKAIGRSAVAMAGAGGPVPTGRVGVWTDGARHAVLATRSASGRIYTVADEGDLTGRTNVFGELNALWLLLAFAELDGSGGAGTL